MGGHNITWTITDGCLQGSPILPQGLVFLTGDSKFWEMKPRKPPLFSIWVCHLTFRHILILYENRGSLIADFIPRNKAKLCKKIRTRSYGLKGKHLTHLTVQVEVTVSSSLHAYIMTQSMALRRVCFRANSNPTCLWITGTGMGTGWRQRMKDLVAGLQALMVRKGRHKHTQSPDSKQKWCAVISRALTNLSHTGVIMGILGWNAMIPKSIFMGEGE